MSHSSRDSWIARVIAEKVEALGATAWLDEKDLDGGSVVVQDILGGIDACQEGLILVSPDSVRSQWVAFEIGALRAQRKRVTAILNGVSQDAIAPMSDVKSVELNKFEQYLTQVERRRRRRP